MDGQACKAKRANMVHMASKGKRAALEGPQGHLENKADKAKKAVWATGDYQDNQVKRVNMVHLA